jgi:colicin import membrane protein
MSATLQTNWQDQFKYLGGALGIHALLGLLLIGFSWSSQQTVVPQLAIKAVMVDRATLNQLARQAPAKPKVDDSLAQQAALEKRQEQERKQQEEQKQELLREQEQMRAETEKQQQLTEKRNAAAAEQKKQQQAAEKQRLADIQQKQRDAEVRRQADTEAKAQKAREAELSAQLAAEEGRANAVNAGLLNQYIALIQQKVIRSWIKPPTAKAGLECEVKVTQATGGTVLSVALGRCNGDQAVRTSIETAVQAASPLPTPPDARLFDRNLAFIFKPSE